MAQWTRLSSSNFASSLLYIFEASNAEYRLFVTDVSRVFCEHLSRVQILQRASDTECHIDPSQDEDQFGILLDNIRAALQGRDGTCVTVVNGGGEELHLSLTAPLPPPLEPFEWIVKLSELAPEDPQNHLMNSLVYTSSVRKRQLEDLIDQLHEKDQIISKLLDKLETSGTDLTTVFPGAAGSGSLRTGRTRDTIARHVKGFARFKEQDWLEQARLTLMPQQLPENTAEELLSAQPLVSGPTRTRSLTLQEWRKENRLPQAVKSGGFLETMQLRKRNRSDSDRSRTETRADAIQKVDFHGRDTSESHRLVSTSPDQMKKLNNVMDEANDGDTTEDESDENDVSASASRAAGKPPDESNVAPPSTAAPPRKQLGMIGGHKNVTPDPHLAKTSPIPTHLHSKKGALGVIRGRIKVAETPTSSNFISSEESTATINETKNYAIAEDISVKSETEEDKAARRRKDLKRALEMKPKAPLKKRRF